MQANLFCGSCQLYGVCGGAKSAPCGCMFVGTDKAYECKTCLIGCRERASDAGDFLAHVNDGHSLSQVRVHHGTDFPVLPLVLPVKGGKSDAHLPVAFATADLEQMLAFFSTLGKNKALHERIRVPAGIPLVGIMNSSDDVLERFWNLPDRNAFFECLSDAGVIAITGPTFSLFDEYEKRKTVTSHHVLMMRRHNRVLNEIADNGIMPIPNLYFRNQFDIDAWANWLRVNNVRILKRDFSMTKNISRFVESEIQSLKTIVLKSGKKFHMIFTGVGSKNADIFLRVFAQIGCTCSFVTSDPMHKAIRGGAELYILNGKMESRQQLSLDRPLLVHPNYIQLEKHLSKIALDEYPSIYGSAYVDNFGKLPIIQQAESLAA